MEREPFAADIVPDIPNRFWKIPYDVAHDRDSSTLKGIETGANCQNFAYELLRYFGRHVPFLRSSNLWDDTEHTIVVDKYQPLDLLLFNRTRNAGSSCCRLCWQRSSNPSKSPCRSRRCMAACSVHGASRVPGPPWRKASLINQLGLLLLTSAVTSVLGQSRRSDCVPMTSGLPREADNSEPVGTSHSCQ
jgi:hypothetical protein